LTTTTTTHLQITKKMARTKQVVIAARILCMLRKDKRGFKHSSLSSLLLVRPAEEVVPKTLTAAVAVAVVISSRSNSNDTVTLSSSPSDSDHEEEFCFNPRRSTLRLPQRLERRKAACASMSRIHKIQCIEMDN